MSKLLRIELDAIERLVRFAIHLERVKDESYQTVDGEIADDVVFIESYSHSIERLLAGILKVVRDDSSDPPRRTEIARKAIELVKELHEEHLLHLPRPKAPIELRRFARILKKQIVNLRGVSSERRTDSPISIFIGEKVGEETYRLDPLEKFRKVELKEFEDLAETTGEVTRSEMEDTRYYIRIPRIDATNPLRWPSLCHEVAHHVMGEIYDDNTIDDKAAIEADFLSYGEYKETEKIAEELGIRLDYWLTECWCDLFSSLLIGPSFWFAQYSAFVFDGTLDKYDEMYPPPLFRLILIQRILSHRLKDLMFDTVNDVLDKCEVVVDQADQSSGGAFWGNRNMKYLFMCFQDYFLGHFFVKPNGLLQFSSSQLSEKIKPIVKYTERIDKDTIKQLIDELNDDLPIPSIRTSEATLSERPTYVQEVLLAGWLYQGGAFHDRISKYVYSGKPATSLLYDDLVPAFEKLDNSILRSIQVAEWMDVLTDDQGGDKESTVAAYSSEEQNERESGCLVDHQIFELLKSKCLRVLPLISIESQLGTSSLDIRLGTSVQQFYPGPGVVDFIKEGGVDVMKRNSKIIDLDFLESIVISPGQFMLAHSMEYIRLPKNLTADLDGRSSFARLGLEIHMTAGMIEHGFEGVLTYEIFNAGPNPIRLYPGTRLAQLRFYQTAQPTKMKKKKPKYRGLLSYHSSHQSEDKEITKIREALRAAEKAKAE